MNPSCLGCGRGAIKTVIDLGPQPPSNRFLADLDESCELHRLQFGYCLTCGLAQLLTPMPVDVVRSRYDWITYNEPEGHLDNLVDYLRKTATITENARVVGVSYKDDSTLARFRKQGVAYTYRLNQVHDMGISDSLASIETIQASLTPETSQSVVADIGPADVVVVRHVLEHAYKPTQFIEACHILAKPDGYLVFEVPDCRKILNGHDHCFLWEEHITYFTPITLKALFESIGFLDSDIKVYPYPMEDSLVAIVRNIRTTPRIPHALPEEIERIEAFGRSLGERGAGIRCHIQSLQAKGIQTALFGAGHLAAKFINFYDLASLIPGVIDDNPKKQSLFMPGSRLPIIDSRCMDEGKVDLCLLTLNPESEQKVLQAKPSYVDRGGRFRSIFSASANSIDMEIRK
ncbi:MAG TPA: class I SAM-dependent methyltransferase [Chryseosolibacter sp.]|nr:class I SAM-dependent methyltransferase [Chryseosolibacter sp.]